MPNSPHPSNLLRKYKRTATAAILLVLLLAILPFSFSEYDSSSTNLERAAAAPNEVGMLNVDGNFFPFSGLNPTGDLQSQVSLQVLPNTVALGDDISFVVEVSPSPPTANDCFTNLTILVYRPDGTIDLLGPFQSDSNGSQALAYKPEMVGSYTARATFAGQMFVNSNVTYLGAESPNVTFSVSSDEVETRELFQGWQVAENGGYYSESEGVITLSGNDRSPGTTLYRNISPQTDFEISLKVKAETLGEVHKDPAGAGEGFVILLRPNASVFGILLGINFELRARGGGQFLVNRHNSVADAYGWPYDWTPFIYNSLGYNDGSSFWQNSSPEPLEKAPVKPDIWYTMVLKVQKTPFVIRAEVLTEDGTLLGSFPIDDINNIGFSDIGCVAISSGFGGTFYVRDFTITGLSA